MSPTLVNLFSLNTSSGIPIYRQLIDQTKQAIRLDLLKAGELLPSVRKLASALQVNPMTISKAFSQLEIEGFLERKRGIGMLVSDNKKSQLISEQLESALQHFVTVARESSLDDESILTLLQQSLSLHQKENK